jgi:hypothetical protein
MVELESELADLASAVEWPTGDVASRVGQRVRAEQVAVTRHRHGRNWRVAVAAVAAIAAATVIVPSSRAAIGNWLGVSGDRINLTSATTSTSIAAAPQNTLAPALDLGPEVALSDVRGQVGFTMPVPRRSGFEHPDEVHVSHPPASGEATLVYRPRAGLPSAGTTDIGMLISAFRADIDAGFFSKTAGPGTRVEMVTVQGGTGYWLEGAPHEFLYRDASGNPVPHTLRLAANVLLWEVNGITVRIESTLPRDDVIRIADAMT